MTSTVVPTLHRNQAVGEVSIGSLCTGYAGLDMGVAAALGGNAHMAWAADNDPHISRLLTHRLPDVPNLGDLASVHWSRAERSEEHTSELQSRFDLVCRLLLEKKNQTHDLY